MRFRSYLLGLSIFTLLVCLPTFSLSATPEPTSYGCVILIDGLRGDMAKKYAEEGLMPNVKEYFLDKGIWADKATSVFPSITGAAIPSVVTGAYPGRHNLPSLYFFEREEKKYYVLYTVKGSWQFNRLLDTKRTKTIFEYFPEKNDTWAIGLHVNRGVDKCIPVAFNVGYKPLAWTAKVTEFFRGIKRAFTGGHKARLVVVYNGWFDHIEHTLGAESEEMKEHYKLVDDQVGECMRMYKKLGIFDKTYFALVSDHGQLSFDKSVNIWEYIKGTHHIPIVENDWKKIPLIPLDWDVNNPDNYEDYVMVVPAGQGHALLYFAKPGETNNWDERPTFEQLKAYPVNGQPVNVIEEARNLEAVDFIVGKDYLTEVVHVFAKGTAEATIERKVGSDGYIYRYTVAGDAIDPLRFTEHEATSSMVNRVSSADETTMFFTDKQWQLATVDSDYPDGVVQLYQIFDSERSPDIYINGAAGYNLIGSTYDGEISRHGALNKYESHTTFAFSGPGLQRQTIKTARSVDMVPTMLHCLQVDFDPSFMDGRVIEPVQQAIMSTSEKATDGQPLEDYLQSLRKLNELTNIIDRMQKIGCSSTAEFSRLMELQRSYGDEADRVNSRTLELIDRYSKLSKTDGGNEVHTLCRYIRTLGANDKGLLKPFIKELVRGVNLELAQELRGCLD